MANVEDEDDGLDLGAVFTQNIKGTPTASDTRTKILYVYQRAIADERDWKELQIRLTGSHPLWGHYLWNAAIALATYLDQHTELYRDKNVLELGAGGALPSLVAVKNGAKNTVITDYPDDSLISNIKFNVENNVDPEDRNRVDVQGYIWGQSASSLPRASYDLIILSDLIFNHSQHDALIRTCGTTLNVSSNLNDPGSISNSRPCVLAFYSHHRPHLAHRDLEFFNKAREAGWVCEEVLTKKFPPMFPEDSGDEEVRSTVHGWMLTRK